VRDHPGVGRYTIS
jgi:hypothetical protein